MTTKRNFSNYSENDSADIQLDESIQSFIAPNVKGSTEIDFDGYGTLHVLERNAEGALLSDSYLVKRDEDEVGNIRDDYTNADKLERLMKQNSLLRGAVRVEKVIIVLFAILFVLFCILLRLTLLRVM